MSGRSRRPIYGATAVCFVLLLVTPQAVAQDSATYELVFEATWSASTHPNHFTPGPHFSGLIGGTHNSGVTFWEEGGIATNGIELMAELGSKSGLQSEIEDAIALGTGGAVISGGGISPSPGSVSVEFTITEDHPLVSVVSMVAPSPDWFVGVDSLSLRDGDQWIYEVTVPLQPYDSGTDSGPTYTSSNADITPHIPIIEMTGLPFADGGPVPPLGTFTFRRLGGDVPATSEWGLIVMALLLVTGASVIFALKRRGTGISPKCHAVV